MLEPHQLRIIYGTAWKKDRTEGEFPTHMPSHKIQHLDLVMMALKAGQSDLLVATIDCDKDSERSILQPSQSTINNLESAEH